MLQPVVVLLCINLAVFLGLFFGLNYHEIVINRDYASAECHIDAATIQNFYCPSVDCGGCDEAYLGTPSCDALSQQWSLVNPSTCGIVNSTASCPVSQVCQNGFYCCQTCCTQTCQSCHSCNCDKNGKNCATCCSDYCCQYGCCQSVSHRQCFDNANVCYNAVLDITYADMTNDAHSTTFTFEEGTNQAAAIDIINNHYAQNTTHHCYYDTTNTANVLWSIAYTTGYWVATSIFTATLFSLFVWISILLVVDAFRGKTRTMWIATVLYFWIGLVLSLGLLLPLYTNNKIPVAGKRVLLPVLISWISFTTSLYLISLLYTVDKRRMLNACEFLSDLCLCMGRYCGYCHRWLKRQGSATDSNYSFEDVPPPPYETNEFTPASAPSFPEVIKPE